MKTITSQCLEAAGIKKIVWIDDFWAAPSRSDSERSILASIDKLKAQGKPKIDIPLFAKVDLATGKGQIEDACVEVMEPMSDEDLVEMAKQLAVLTGVVVDEIKPQLPDLLPKDFKALREVFGPGLRRFSLADWTSAGVREFTSVSDDTLFLIDKEFTREPAGAGMDGTTILVDMVNKGAFCIMLTHTCTEASQEDTRTNIADSTKLLRHRFLVLSKLQDEALPMDPRFARAIRALMTHKFNGEIAHRISETIEEAAKDTAAALTAQSVSDLERALFENADEEGVLEYDAVLRIFEILQRHALNQALQDSQIQNQLRASRKFRQETAQLQIGELKGDMTFFRGLRSREVFFEGVGINKLHAPLTCGDVFETDMGTRYLLLGQPCDLMVRNSDGKRRAEFGLLVLISDGHKPDPDDPVPNYRYYDLKEIFGTGKKSYIDFRNLLVVDLFVLDFAAFNAEGSVELRSNHPAPSMVLTKGWARRLKAAKCRVFPKNKPAECPTIGMGKHALKLAGNLFGDCLRYPIRRIGRLQSSTATAMLAGWATFQTRAAFDHDFARPRVTEPAIEEYSI